MEHDEHLAKLEKLAVSKMVCHDAFVQLTGFNATRDGIQSWIATLTPEAKSVYMNYLLPIAPLSNEDKAQFISGNMFTSALWYALSLSNASLMTAAVLMIENAKATVFAPAK